MQTNLNTQNFKDNFMDLSIIKRLYNEKLSTKSATKPKDDNDASTILHYRTKSGRIIRKVSEEIVEEEIVEEESLDEVSNYDAVVTYYRDQLHLDPYKLKGEVGKQLRDKIKMSPAFRAWMKINKYESVDIISDDQLDEVVGAGLNTKSIHKHLISNGWKSTGPSGSHNNYSHPESSTIISVPRHAKDINRITAMKILKQSTNLNKSCAAANENVSVLTMNILEKIKEVKQKSSKPSEEITFFGTGQEKKSKKPTATVDYGTEQ
jgi:predicted RNA binding protein YcfA (HicA-like mRNA interferase family)